MKTDIAPTSTINLSTGSRIARLLAGAGLIGTVLASSPDPLGTLALLPLLGIYPVFTGLTGWDPIKAACKTQKLSQCLLRLPRTARLAIGAAGIAMLGSVYLVSGTPGWLTMLPLLAVYPLFIAITGEEPIAVLYNLDTRRAPNTGASKPQVRRPKQVEFARQVEDHHDLAA